MNKEWSDQNKLMQLQIKKESTFSEGIDNLIDLRCKLFNQLLEIKKELTDENAFWLVDYWCGKDIKGLIQMPFSRHWIMHIEASNRIRNRILM